MKRLIAFLVLLGATAVYAQPVPPGGLRKVNHDTTLTGAGTLASALGLAPCGSTGETWIWNGSAFACGTAGSSGVTNVDTLAPLQGGPITTTGTVSLSLCSANQVLKMNAGATAWACAADAGGISNSAGANVIMMSDGTNAVASSATDNGTTWAINTNKVTVTEASGNTAIAGTLSVTGNGTETGTWTVNGGLTAGDSTSADSHTVNGTVVATANGTAANDYSFTESATGSTVTKSVILAQRTGSSDATAGIVTNNVINASATATKSAGTNAVRNNAVRASATGGDLNVAYLGADGDNEFNTSSGSTLIGYTIGATAPAKLSVSGTADITGAVGLHSTLDLNSHQIHNVTDGSSAQDAATVAQLTAATTGANQVTGTLTSGMIPVATGANTVGDSSIKDDGTSVKINTNKLVITESTGSAVSSGFFQGNGGIYAGSNSQVYLTKGTGKEGLGCFFATNGTATCKINPVGYAEGQTQFRDLDIEDGKGNSAVYVTGSTLGAEFKGAVTADTTLGVTGDVTLGSSTSNVLTLHGSLAVNTDDLSVNASTHQVFASGEVTAGTLTSRGDSTLGGASTNVTKVEGRLEVNTSTASVSTCGTSSVLHNGNANSGYITTGTSASTCTLNLGATFSNAPNCTISEVASSGTTDTALFVSSTSTTQLSFHYGGNAEGVMYVCMGR